MISLVILLILAWSFYIGYSRGIVLQIYYTISAVVSAIIAGQMYQSLGEQINLLVPYASAQEGTFTYFFPSSQLFQLDKVFYAGLAYLVIYTIVYSIARFIGIFIHLVPNKKANDRWYNVASGVLALCVTLFGIQILLTVLATIPLPLVQNHLNASGLARFIISHTPITSGMLKQLWVTKIIG